MKGGRPLAEVKEEYRINGFCLVCGKGFQYPYGRHHVAGQMQSGTCSKACEAIKEPKNEMLAVCQRD
jgi:polynucleotide 5'-kinase involved in rRNA processing